MPDPLTLLEDKLDAVYKERTTMISNAEFVTSWDDYNFRAGFLEAIRSIGKMLEEIKNPEKPKETGEIPNIFEGEKNG